MQNLDGKILSFASTSYAQLVKLPVSRTIAPLAASIPRSIAFAGRKWRFVDSVTAPFLVLGWVFLIATLLIHEQFFAAFFAHILREHLGHLEREITIYDQHRSKLDIDINFVRFVVTLTQSIGDILLCYTLVLVSHYHPMGLSQLISYVLLLVALLLYESWTLWIRIDDFFPPTYSASVPAYARVSGFGKALGVSVRGKLRQKMKWVGLSLACLGAGDPSGIIGGVTSVVLGVTLVLAHMNVVEKARVRAEWSYERKNKGKIDPLGPVEQEKLVSSDTEDSDAGKDGAGSEFSTVYTIGCFDMFHSGHFNLLRTMRRMGKRVVVGLHDDHSIFQLKGRYPICNTVKRLRDVKKYADQVYIIASTDPSAYLDGIIDRKDAARSVYVRGNDMPNFPGRHIAEALLSIRLIPYTQGVSSTALRKQLTQRRRMSADDTEEEVPSPAKKAGGKESAPPFWVYYENRWEMSNVMPAVDWIEYGEDYVRYYTTELSPTIH